MLPLKDGSIYLPLVTRAEELSPFSDRLLCDASCLRETLPLAAESILQKRLTRRGVRKVQRAAVAEDTSGSGFHSCGRENAILTARHLKSITAQGDCSSAAGIRLRSRPKKCASTTCECSSAKCCGARSSLQPYKPCDHRQKSSSSTPTPRRPASSKTETRRGGRRCGPATNCGVRPDGAQRRRRAAQRS